ncbi:hypothetical protein Tco_0356405 [Tanacetum coccineum]
MAVLESCPKHNMVAYLKKTTGNAEFHEVIDFLCAEAHSQLLHCNPSKESDLLFDDADGIDSLPNQAIFDAIQLMGYEGDLTVLTFNKALHLDAKKKFVMYPRFISIFLDKQLMNVPVPLDHFPVNALTSKVFSFMVKKGKHFSGKVTPLFASMLVQPTEDEGATSERPSEPQPTPSPPHPSEANVEPQSDPSPRPSPTTHIPDSIPESSGGNHGGHSSSDKSLSGNEGDMTLQSVYDLKKKAKPVITHHRAWMKSGRKSAKAEPSVHKDPLFDELPDDTLDYMDTEDAQDVGRTRDVVNEEKETADDKVSTEDALSTAQQKVSTDKEKVSTDRPNVSTDRPKVNTDKEKDSTLSSDEGTVDQTEGRSATPTTPTTTPTMFGDDETIAQVLLNMSQAKAVSREKEKGVELKDVEETERPRPTSTRSLLTLKPLPKIDPKDKGKKKIEEEDESDTEFEGIPEAEKKFNQLARDEEMARKECVHVGKRRAKFLHDTIAAQRRFLAEQRAIAIRNKPPTRTQLTFTAGLGSTEDERRIKDEMKEEKEKDNKSDVDSDDEHKKCLKIVTFKGTMDSEIMERKSVIARLNKVSSPDGDYLVIYRANGNFRALNCLLEKKMIKVISEMINKIGRLSLGDCMEVVGLLLELKMGYSHHYVSERRWKAKDVDEDGKCLKIRSRCVKVFGYILQELKKINLKKHEVKQVQQSCLGEDCWELYIPDLVPLDSAYTISIHSQCFSIVNLYLYKLAITLSRLQRSVQFRTHKHFLDLVERDLNCHVQVPLSDIVERGQN